MPREGHGSRNDMYAGQPHYIRVMPREGHGSRNDKLQFFYGQRAGSHAPRGAWE